MKADGAHVVQSFSVVNLSSSVSGISGSLTFGYRQNVYSYSVPFTMTNETISSITDQDYIVADFTAPYNVAFQFPTELLGTRITGTWHIPLQISVTNNYYYWTGYSIELSNEAQFSAILMDSTIRSWFALSDNSFPDGVSVSLVNRDSNGWYDLTLIFDDFLLPANYYSNYFSIDLDYNYHLLAYYENSVESPIVQNTSAIVSNAALYVRSSSYISQNISLSLPQIGNATNSQLYYDVLAAINNANISYDITVDGTDVTVDIDTSSLAQQTTVANILTVLNNLKSDTSSIPALSSNFSTFATAALTYLGNISAGSDVISDVLDSVLLIYDRIGLLNSQLASIYDLLSSNFSDYMNSYSSTPYSSSFSFSNSLPASFSSLVAYHFRQSRSPSVSTPATFNNIQAYGISGIFSDYSLDRVISVDYLTGTVKSYSYVEFDHCTVRSENGIYFWDFTYPDYNYLTRDVYFVSNIATYGTGGVNNLWIRGSVFRYYPSDQSYNTSALANSFLSSTPLRIYFFDDSFVSSTSHVTIDSFAPRSSLSCTNGIIAEVSYVLSTLYPFNNLSSLIASYVVGFTGITSNSVTDLSSISQNTFNRWVSIIQQAIYSQLNNGSGDLSIEASLAAADVDYLHNQIESPLWLDVSSKLDDIEGFTSEIPSGVPTAAVWFVGLIEDVWDALGPFGYVLGTSLVVGFIVILFGVINHFPRGFTSDDSMAYRYDSDSGTWKHL